MSLDKDRILNDLGNVMSQLQSADCGCMGKLFSNPNPPNPATPGMGMGHPLPTCGGCRRGCCRGHGHPMAPNLGCNNSGMYQSEMSQPEMGQPFIDHTGTYQTGMEQTGMGQPGMVQSGMAHPGMGQPGKGQSGMAQPGMGHRAMPMNGPMNPGMGCMGAHAPKLYADTYNYLSKNLMNPIVQEVYEDLKTITPMNTMTNNPLGAQMGLQPGTAGTAMTQPPQNVCNAGMPRNGMDMADMVNQGSMNQMVGNPQKMGMDPVGMGPQIAKMMMGDGTSKKVTNPVPLDVSYGQQQGSTPSGAMAKPGFMSMGQGNPGSIGMGHGNPGSVGIGQRNPASMGIDQGNSGSMGLAQGNPGSMGMGQVNPAKLGLSQDNPASMGMTKGNRGSPMVSNVGQANPGLMGMSQGHPGSMGMGQGSPANMGTGMAQGSRGSPMVNNMGQGNPGSQMQDANTVQANYLTQQGMNQPQHQSLAGGKQQNAINADPAMQQMEMGNRDYGEHTEGMKKFNEMFPGVTGVGGDLGFDPMAIAFKMNPANHKQSALNTMNQMLMGDRNKWMTAANSHLQASFSQGNQKIQPMPQQQQQLPGQTQMNDQGQQQMLQQQAPQGQLQSVPPIQHQGTPVPLQQQVTTGAPITNQQLVNPNTGAPTNPTTLYTNQQFTRQGYGTNAQMQRQPTQVQPGQTMYKEHLLPADSFRNIAPPPTPSHNHKQYHYNTIGQAVEMLPAQMYKTVQESGPQTLSPQPVPAKRNIPANVKYTESKTSIMDIIDGRGTISNPGKTQLQQIYNQYKGSPYTPQNLPTRQGRSLSEGHLTQIQNSNEHQRAQPPIHPAFVEQVGGDTFANNDMAVNKVEQVMGQIGDVPAETPNETPDDDTVPPMDQMKPVRKDRNGLQDRVYTSAPITNRWSFGNRVCYPAPHLYRSNRAVKW